MTVSVKGAETGVIVKGRVVGTCFDCSATDIEVSLPIWDKIAPPGHDGSRFMESYWTFDP